ncbi:universal stress protein [Actinomadura verrucosospora]|uniref:Universal stress protein UspA-like protein n=1 Tax=Actinomadura verrucosospora TaxID=46165 RepID=A0A7D4A3N4_ACTVE|nr:universal stress protein [Actinomadura verrucosospora]QKG19527.1 universal stress protein UspA-like protein [Actinomadura verrucosospora]
MSEAEGRASRPLRVLAGYSPDERGDDALALAALVLRGVTAPRTVADVRLTVANVHPPAWPARGPGSVDAEWVGYLKDRAGDALERAAGRLAELNVAERRLDLRVHAHRGSGRGLIEVAAETGADVIVIGSAPRGRRGRVAIGSTADQLLHGSPVPVLLAPRGYAANAPDQFERLTVAYWRRPDTDGPLEAAARAARVLALPVRLVTLVLRPPGLSARFRNADDVMARQLDRAERDLAHAAGRLAAAGDGVVVRTEAVAGTGTAKALAAVDMLPGELLACASSHDGPLRKVFLGEGSGKIVRAAPCPVLVLPRGARAVSRTENAQVR